MKDKIKQNKRKSYLGDINKKHRKNTRNATKSISAMPFECPCLALVLTTTTQDSNSLKLKSN